MKLINNMPNFLTILRIFLTPVICFLLFSNLKFKFLTAFIIFCIASLTDYLDGNLARRTNPTNFGKFFDPIADKILMFSSLIGLLVQNMINPWVIILLLSLDFIVMFLRILMAQRGRVLAANKYGKLKTLSQMLAVMIAMLLKALSEIWGNFNINLTFLYNVLFYISFIMSIFSLYSHILNNKKELTEIFKE
ncbi:MAG: CDP-diacylglycerol--glycerol-3-phosphate 3-phosphatidyltransferase [Candidatus Improbicoccus devescovinae]|nr:MAG: CDP-diacylglycerol--glycerol-3-phosphate 3-phosphatidyltransferase [Candidatus Improbicoccus devescovinae]